MSSGKLAVNPKLYYMQGESEMKTLTRTFNWAGSVLGDPQQWPQSLHTTLSIILNSKFPMFLFWGADSICFYNDAYRPSLGNNGKHPAVGMRGVDCWPDIWPVIKPLIDQVLGGGKATWSENQLIPIYRNGHMEDVYWTFSYSPVFDETTEPAGVFVTCTETTEQIKSNLREQASKLELRESEEALQFAINAAALGTFDLNPSTMRFKANDRLKAWFGLEPKEEVELKKAIDVIEEKDRGRVTAAIDKAMTFGSGGHYDVDYAIINPLDTQPRYVIAKGKALFNSKHEPIRFSGTVQDVTEERMAQRELERSYEQARLSKEAAQLGTFDFNLVENTLEWDERCRTLFGISHKGPVSYEKDFVNGLHIDDRDRIINIINNVFIKSVSNGDFDVEYRTVGAEDGKLRWIRAKGKTFFNEKDEPVRFVGSVLDITDKKLDELRKNDFIGMVSHELKTPLTSLKGYVQLLNARAKKEENDFALAALLKAETQVNKMNSMISGFLNVSRLESSKIHLSMQQFNFDKLVEEIIAENLLINPSHIIKLAPCDPFFVNADRDKIGYVINNLVNNAVKYSPRGSPIEVCCEIKDNQAQLSVRDEGIGIKQQDKERLFERYYRVKNADTQHISGFGIGLYLSAEIIQQHHGQIGVESEAGKGSTFWFTVPISPLSPL